MAIGGDSFGNISHTGPFEPDHVSATKVLLDPRARWCTGVKRTADLKTARSLLEQAQEYRVVRRRAEWYDARVGEIVYLDICCFKRPFDDATLERVRREAEHVAAILDAAQRGRVRLVRSPAHDFENERNPREDRRLATRLWLDAAVVRVSASRDVAERARELAGLGFAPLDALHLACAEHSNAEWFVTTDDRLLNRARTHRARLRVQVLRPDHLPSEGGNA